MKKAVIYGKGDLKITTMEIPRVTPGKVLIRTSFCAVCGTDLHVLEGNFPVGYPYFPGHECSGIVQEIGEGVTSLRAGDRVTWIPMANPCGACVFCRAGKPNFCLVRNRRELGGFAEYALMEERQVYPLPAGVSLKAGALMEPLSIAVHALDYANVRVGDRVVIIGGGAIGLLLLQLVLRSGAHTVILSEPDEMRRTVAKRFGAHATVDPMREDLNEIVLAHTGGLGPDVVFEAAGVPQTCEQSVLLAKRGGTVMFVGVVPPERKVQLSHFEIFSKELIIRGVAANFQTYGRAVQMLERLDLDSLVTHEFDLKELAAALEFFKTREGIKILIRC